MRRQRGQALVELALAVPFIAGLLALTLQGGLLFTDQVNLQQFAYDGTQWAQHNPSTADTTAITQHIVREICDSANIAVPGPRATRFCRAGSSLNVSVTANRTPTSLVSTAATQAVLAATTDCKPWALTAVADKATVNAANVPGPQVNIVVGFTPASAPAGAGTDPVITLSGPTIKPVMAFDEPPKYTHTIKPRGSNGTSATTVVLRVATNTAPNLYTIQFTGTDQCGHSQPSPRLLLQVNNATYSTPHVPSTSSITGVNPTQLCQNTATVVTIFGSNFLPGSSVIIGGVPATSVVVTDPNTITATTGLLTPGGKALQVVAPGGTVQAALISAVNVVAVCPGASSAPPAANACAFDVPPNPFQTKITITWSEPLVIPALSGGITLTATDVGFCQ